MRENERKLKDKEDAWVAIVFELSISFLTLIFPSTLHIIVFVGEKSKEL